MPPPDAALAARVVDHDDRAAFAELVARHQAKVRGLLRKLTSGDHAQADDLAQETFLRAYRRMSTFEGAARFSTWLCQIAYHAFLDARTHAATAAKHEREAARDAEVVVMPADGEAGALLRHDVERALAGLSDVERAALALTFGQDLTHEEAARILGAPLGTLKTTVARGLEKLERRMHPWRSIA